MGTRLAAHFPDIPKPMIPLAGKPLLQHQIEMLVAQGFPEITLIVGYKAEVIREYFRDGSGFGARIAYIVEDSPLGSGGALTLLTREDTLLLLGDVYGDIDFARFVAYHQGKNAAITLFAHPNSHPHDSDIIVVDEEGRVAGWHSKHEAQRGERRNLVNAGLYIFRKESLPSGAAAKCDLEHDIIVPQLGNGRVYAYRSTEYVKDMGTPARLAQVEGDLKSGMTAARNLKNKQKAVFLDRDGTINVDRGIIADPELIELLPGVAEAIRRLNQSPYLAICVTNQSVIARGETDFAGLKAIHARLDTLLGAEGAYLDDLIFCPHHPDSGYEGERPEYKIACECRKPKPGLLLRAAEMYNIALSQSYMIGDRTSDIAAGQAAGCHTIGVRTGSALADGRVEIEPDLVCEGVREAVERVVGNI
jgi:D-glycero-D-manno-heptose 1,7-bisphosphate phosphatase